LRATTQLHRKASQIEKQFVRNFLAALQELVLKKKLVRRLAEGREAHWPVDDPRDSARNQRSSVLEIAKGLGQAGLFSRKLPTTSAKMPDKKAACYIHDPSSCSSSSTAKFWEQPKQKPALGGPPQLNFQSSLESDYAVAR